MMRAALAGFALAATLSHAPVFAQSASSDPGAEQSAASASGGGIYKPPLRGAPGGRVGGASRGAKSAASLPTIELVAPLNHTGETASATPVLYFFVSQPVTLPTQFTISAPLRPKPIVEATIPAPSARGLYALRLADYRAQLDPGIVYTWSVSAIVDSRNWSRNVVASATILRVPPDVRVDGTLGAAPPDRRAALLAGAGLWYDAVAAAADGKDRDRHAALDELLTEVGLIGSAGADRGDKAAPPILR
jgi:Domain of Unknown Function (DUF928)